MLSVRWFIGRDGVCEMVYQEGMGYVMRDGISVRDVW